MSDTLLIGYGNSLRRDDGVGPTVARRFVDRSGVTVIEAHQLVPEHIERVAGAPLVVLVDAAVDIPAGAVQRQQIEAAEPGSLLLDLHELDPTGLVTGAVELYGRAPEVWLITIGAEDLGFGEGLSPTVIAAIPDAVAAVERVISRHS